MLVSSGDLFPSPALLPTETLCFVEGGKKTQMLPGASSPFLPPLPDLREGARISSETEEEVLSRKEGSLSAPTPTTTTTTTAIKTSNSRVS